jgi:hypothetical protein
MYACSPGWKADWISRDDLERTLEQLARTIRPSPGGPDAIGVNDGLHFTGGEPFLNFRLLCAAVEIAAALGIPSTFVETNCAWAVDDRVARDRLRLLREKGLRGILVSVNPFYLEYVPFERTERVVDAAVEVFGANVIVYQLDYYRRFRQWGMKSSMPLEEYLRLEGAGAFAGHVEFFAMGRAPYALEGALAGVFARHRAERFVDDPCWPPMLRDWHNHFDNYGNYVPGFCGGISLGDCRELETLTAEGIDLGERPVLAFLAREDMRGLLEFALERGYRDSPRGYFSKCHLCVDLRRHLAERGEFEELAPRQFYDHLALAGRRPKHGTEPEVR